MLLTLSAHCLLSNRPRPEIDAIGHRSPFCEQFLTECALTTQAISRKDQSHMLQHMFPAPSVKENEGRCVVQRLNDSGSYSLPHAQLLVSLCGLLLPRTFFSSYRSLSFSRYLFRYDGSMMPGVFLKYLHATSVLNIAHSLV